MFHLQLLDLMMPWLSLNVIWYLFPLRLPANVMPNRLTTNSLELCNHHHLKYIKTLQKYRDKRINHLSTGFLPSKKNDHNQVTQINPSGFLTSPWFLLINPSTWWWSWLTPIEAAGWSFPKVTSGYVLRTNLDNQINTKSLSDENWVHLFT